MHPPQKPDHPGEFDQVLRHIQSILGDEEQRRKLLGSQGDFAQEWLDLFQLLAEYPKITINLQSSIFKLMIRLSRNSGLHPQCLTIWGVEKLGDDPVGGGAFGDVWQGRIGQQLVCLKVVRAFRRSDIQLILKDYMQEAIIWRQLDHPNVLPFMGIYYLDKEQKRLCLVSPWMERGNLIDFMSTSPDLVDHDLLAYDVACGLSYLHAKKIVHGDLKGVNILITPELRACLGDFGLSRVSATQVLVTETSRSKGTMRWLSPELMRPGPSCVPSRESDVYAYACVCYEIFTGRVPFYELVEAAIVFAVLMDKQHPTRPEDCTKLRGSMWDVMTSCWDETPSSRPAIADVLTRIHEMNADRILEPASSWNNPVFTRVWNDPEHPPVTSEIHEQAVKGFIADETYAWSLPRSPSGSRSGTGTTERPDNQPHGASTSGSDRTVIDVPTDLVLEPVTTPTIPSPSLGGPKTIKGSRTFVPETVARIVTPEGVEVSSDKSKSERHASSGSITSLPTGSAVTLSTAILNPKGPNAKTLKKKEAKRRKKEAEERAKKAAVEKEREVEQKRNEEEQRKREELNKKEHPRGEQSAAVGEPNLPNIASYRMSSSFHRKPNLESSLEAETEGPGADMFEAAVGSPEVVDREVEALLSQITMDFDSISDQIIVWANRSGQETNGRTLIQVIRLICEKAADNGTFSDVYARLCRKMMEQISPQVQDDGIKNAEGKPIAGGQLFRKYLLNRCQEDFERGWVAKEATAAKSLEDQAKSEKKTEGEEVALYSDEYYAAQKAKRQGLGLIRFIGELFKLRMLTERIMHECVKKLLGNVENPEEGEIESLCKLLTTVGQILDTPKARAHMDVYFSRMKELTKSPNVSSRMQFMLQDVIELRERKWAARNTVATPQTISQIREQAVKAEQAKEAHARNLPMSRSGSRRGTERPDTTANPEGWTPVASGGSVRAPPKAGDLSKFGQISNKGAPMTFGPSSVFNKKEAKRESLSRTNSSANMFQMLQNDAVAEASTSKSSRPPSRKASIDLTHGGMSEAEAKKRIEEDSKEFFGVRNIDEAEDYLQKLPGHFHHLLVEKLVSFALESKDADAQLVSDLLERVNAKSLASSAELEKAFLPLAEYLDDIVYDAPKAPNYFARMLKGAGFSDEQRTRITSKSEGNGTKVFELSS